MDQDATENIEEILDFKPWFNRRPFKYFKKDGKVRNVGSSVKNKVKNLGSNVKGKIKRRFGRDEFQEFGNTVYSATEKLSQVEHSAKINQDGSYDVEYVEVKPDDIKKEQTEKFKEEETIKDSQNVDFYALQVVEGGKN